MRDDILKIKMTAYWDDNSGNIETRKDDTTKVTITGGNFKKWDPLFKLDFLADMETWVQEQVNKAHEEISDEQSFQYSYMMRCPKSTKQMRAEEENPNLKEYLHKQANLIRAEVGKRRFGQNVIQFPKKTNEVE